MALVEIKRTDGSSLTVDTAAKRITLDGGLWTPVDFYSALMEAFDDLELISEELPISYHTSAGRRAHQLLERKEGQVILEADIDSVIRIGAGWDLTGKS